VSDKTVRKWIKAGVLTAYQFQGEWRIRKADAVVFVERARFQV
jgi:excisionase family DNA binding protein